MPVTMQLSSRGTSTGLAAALAEAGVAAVGWRTDCSDAGAALFAAPPPPRTP